MTANSTNIAPKPNEAWFEDTWWWKIKMRLQWTGWLQYVPNLVVATVMLILAGLCALTGAFPWFLVAVTLALSVALYANLLFDIATVRFELHPAEPLPECRDDLDAFDLMRARVSCRSFQRRKMKDAHREAVLAEAQRQSSPEGLIGERPIRFEYVAAPLTVWPVVGASEFLVAIAPKTYSELAVVDVGRSLEKVVLAATRMGLATCWIGPGADQASIIEHLGDGFDPSLDHVICVCAVGYASRYKPLSLRFMQKSQRWRKPLSELFFDDPSFARPLNTDAATFDQYARCFEVCQWSPSSYNGQTTRAVVTCDGDDVVRVDFCAATHSRFYAMVALGIWVANWETGVTALGKSGNLAVLNEYDRGTQTWPDLPRYVISWMAKAT